MIDIDTLTEFDDDSYDPEEEMGSHDASASPWSCLFPKECCMPGPHGPDECYTGAMEDEYEDEELEPDWEVAPASVVPVNYFASRLAAMPEAAWRRVPPDLLDQVWAAIGEYAVKPMCSSCGKEFAHAGGTLCNDCLTRLAWSVGK